MHSFKNPEVVTNLIFLIPLLFNDILSKGRQIRQKKEILNVLWGEWTILMVIFKYCTKNLWSTILCWILKYIIDKYSVILILTEYTRHFCGHNCLHFALLTVNIYKKLYKWERAIFFKISFNGKISKHILMRCYIQVKCMVQHFQWVWV